MECTSGPEGGLKTANTQKKTNTKTETRRKSYFVKFECENEVASYS